jgi:two-component system, sensor histidine kinase and response regulator
MPKPKILVVDDENDLLNGIRDILSLDGYEVVTAVNGLEGLKVLEREAVTPELIISDIMMPVMDGYTFVEEVRKESRWVNIPFIFLTALNSREKRIQGTSLGADAYLAKPFDAGELMVVVESQLKRKTERMQSTQNAVEGVQRQLMAMVEHELRTPLFLIVNYAAMLKDVQQDPNVSLDTMDFLSGITQGASRLHQLVENLLLTIQLTNGEATRMMLERSKLLPSLLPMIEEAHRQVTQYMPYECDIQFDVDVHHPPVYGDAHFLTIIFRELLSNAVKFSRGCPTCQILVTLRRQKNELEFSIEDKGVGIPPSEINNIWKPFYQFDREKREDQGAGNGLAIVDGLVNLHQGRRKVETLLNHGSRFSVYLPLGS